MRLREAATAMRLRRRMSWSEWPRVTGRMILNYGEGCYFVVAVWLAGYDLLAFTH